MAEGRNASRRHCPMPGGIPSVCTNPRRGPLPSSLSAGCLLTGPPERDALLQEQLPLIVIGGRELPQGKVRRDRLDRLDDLPFREGGAGRVGAGLVRRMPKPGNPGLPAVTQGPVGLLEVV